MIFTKTLKIRINVPSEQETLLRQMTEQYRQACNFISEYVFTHSFDLNFFSLNKVLYRDIRGKFSLKSQLAQSSIKTVIARYKTVKEQLLEHPYRYKDEKGEWQSIPKTLEWLFKPVYFSRPQTDLVRNRDYSFVENGSLLSINTLCERIKCTYEREHFKEYFDGSWRFGTAKLVELKGLWYLHIPVTREKEDFKKENVKHIVGIDRGLRFLSVSYDEEGKTEFISGKKIATKRNKFLELRRELQAKGTKSARRRLKAISGRENRWMSDVNHQISKTLVRKYGKDTLFVLEDLTGVSFDERNLSRTAKLYRELAQVKRFSQCSQNF